MVFVENVTTIPISTLEELRMIIERGSERRHVSGTNMNEESSRSHLILSVVIESIDLQTQSVARGKVIEFTMLFYLLTCNLFHNILNTFMAVKKIGVSLTFHAWSTASEKI